MSGTVSGGKKATITNKARWGEDFYVQTGRKGGAKSKGGGFAKDKTWALENGIKAAQARGRKVKPNTLRKLAALKAPRGSHGQFIRQHTLEETYGSLTALEPRTVYVQKEVPGWLYGVWVIGTVVAIMFSFFLGSIAYK